MRRDWLILWSLPGTDKGEASIIEMHGGNGEPPGFDYDQTSFAIPREAVVAGFIELPPGFVPEVILRTGNVTVRLPYKRKII